MFVKKSLLTTLAAIILTFVPAAVAIPAYAASNTPTVHQNFFDGLISFLAQKFGLDKTQVQSAVTDYRNQQKQQMQQKMQNKLKTRLDTLVQQGKITSDRETAIMNELNSLKIDPSSLQGKTPQERMQAMKNQRNAFTAWAKSQNIDPTIIMPLGGMRMMGNRGFRHGWGNKNVTPTQIQSGSIQTN